MSVELVKSVSINPIHRTISVTSASNNVTPRTYGTWNPLGDKSPFTFESWLRAFASDCFDGSSQFLPSCESLAHEAYLRTCQEMGGDWCQTYERYDFDSAEYADFKERWCSRFIELVLSGSRDRRKFNITRNGRPVTVSVRRSRYGGLVGSYRYANHPKAVSWIRQAVICGELSGFESVPVA